MMESKQGRKGPQPFPPCSPNNPDGKQGRHRASLPIVLRTCYFIGGKGPPRIIPGKNSLGREMDRHQRRACRSPIRAAQDGQHPEILTHSHDTATGTLHRRCQPQGIASCPIPRGGRTPLHLQTPVPQGHLDPSPRRRRGRQVSRRQPRWPLPKSLLGTDTEAWGLWDAPHRGVCPFAPLARGPHCVPCARWTWNPTIVFTWLPSSHPAAVVVSVLRTGRGRGAAAPPLGGRPHRVKRMHSLASGTALEGLGPDSVLQREMLLHPFLSTASLLSLASAAKGLLPYRAQIRAFRVERSCASAKGLAPLLSMQVRAPGGLGSG
jgi:hypothetical protein